MEFADYRNYTTGDDLRNVDWNIYARLDKLVLKLFEQEQDLQIHFLIDASASMHWLPPRKTPGPTKFDTARRMAASLAYIGLANLDRVNCHWFSMATAMGIARGRNEFHKVLEFLRNPPAHELLGPTQLLASARTFAQHNKRRGLVFLLSDLLDPNGCQEALAFLRHSQFEVQVVHILDPAEIHPECAGDLRLIETETAQSFEVTATPALLASYHQEVDRFLKDTVDFCRQRAIGYAFASTSVVFEDLVLKVLRQNRMLG